jgi:hypothetical protein
MSPKSFHKAVWEKNGQIGGGACEFVVGLLCPLMADSPLGCRGRSARSRLTECSSCSSRVLARPCFDLFFQELLTLNLHPMSSTQQAEQASFTCEKIPRRASKFF